jgi:hypothetical protein
MREHAGEARGNCEKRCERPPSNEKMQSNMRKTYIRSAFSLLFATHSRIRIRFSGVSVSLVQLAALGLTLLAFSAPRSVGQMVSPDIDRDDEPFSYFSKPTDIIGVMNAPSAAEISPEGYLYTGFGELMFFAGPEQMPISARIRTLEEGDLPIVSYAVSHLGIHYRFTAFAAQIPPPKRGERGGTGNVVNFVHITLQNPGKKPRAAFLTTAMRYQAEQTTEVPMGDNRFRRPAEADRIGDYQQPGEAFRGDWTYSMDKGACLRDGRVLFMYPEEPVPRLSLTLRTHYNRTEPLTSSKLQLSPTTPFCSATYTIKLAPGESRSLYIKLPLIPMPRESPEFAQLGAAHFEQAHAQVADFWRSMLNRGMRIDLPEAKPVEAFYASLVYDLLALNQVQDAAVQTVNQFQYHRFYLRDSADFVRMYDATGYSDIGSQVIRFFPTRQQPDGNFVSQPGQYDGWGEALWAFGEHYKRTHDLEFEKAIYPRIERAVDWLIEARSTDPLHVMPASDVRDNEYVSGHLTGYNFLALDGLQSAIATAKLLGHSDDAARFQHEYDDYRKTFFALLDAAAAKAGGTLPPSLDAGEWKGTDWGNLLSVTPEPVLDPWDPRVTATLKSALSRYQEGISTYAEPDDGVFLHHYLTIKNTLTELARGEQEQAIREFYAELLHTSSTHTGFEYAIRPWGSRDFEGNIAPHGWFAADYRNLLRNMLVREDNGSLHLLSALSPEWIGKGKAIRVTSAPTYFGNLDFTLAVTDDRLAVLKIDSKFERPPQEIVLHLPWFLDISSVTADGRPIDFANGAAHLPATVREVRITWKSRRPVNMNYQRTVDSYKKEYRRRYELLLDSGETSLAPDTWQVPE